MAKQLREIGFNTETGLYKYMTFVPGTGRSGSAKSPTYTGRRITDIQSFQLEETVRDGDRGKIVDDGMLYERAFGAMKKVGRQIGADAYEIVKQETSAVEGSDLDRFESPLFPEPGKIDYRAELSVIFYRRD